MNISFLLDFYGDMLTPKQREFLDYYYNEDLSLSEIAANVGITRQGVRDSIKRAEMQLFEMEERLHLAQRFRDMRVDFEQIARDARAINDANDRSGYSREIADCAGRILRLSQKLMDS